MPTLRKNSKGFGVIEIVVLIAIVFVLIALGVALTQKDKSPSQSATTKAPTTTTKKPVTTDIYAGWKTATSTRAKFIIKYPSDWTYSETVGTNDNVEHITVIGPHFKIAIDSYSGNDVANGGTAQTTCADCTSTVSTQTFNSGKIGSLKLNTATYTLDSGVGNALVLVQPDDTYYIPSATATNVTTTFRGISALDSLQAYQNETTSEFTANPDYLTAQNILKSVSY